MNKWQPSWTLVTWEMPLDTRASHRRASRFIRAVRTRCGHSYWGTRRKGAALCHGAPDRIRELLGEVPDDARVALLGITDAQYGQMSIRWGHRRTLNEAVAGETKAVCQG